MWKEDTKGIRALRGLRKADAEGDRSELSQSGMAMNVIIAAFAARLSGQFSDRLDETATALPCIACATDDQSSAGSRDGALLV